MFSSLAHLNHQSPCECCARPSFVVRSLHQPCVCVHACVCPLMYNFWGSFLSNPLSPSAPRCIQNTVARDKRVWMRCSEAPWRSFPGWEQQWERPFRVLLELAGHFCKISLCPLTGAQTAKVWLEPNPRHPDLAVFDSCNLRNTKKSILLWHGSYGLLNASMLGSKQTFSSKCKWL